MFWLIFKLGNVGCGRVNYVKNGSGNLIRVGNWEKRRGEVKPKSHLGSESDKKSPLWIHFGTYLVP